MSKKITKEDIFSKRAEGVMRASQEEPQELFNDSKEEEEDKESAEKEIKREEVVSGIDTPQQQDIEALKRELKAEIKGELLRETRAVEVKFQKTLRPGSDKIAEKLNNEEYVLTIWETDTGEPAGYVEEVKINGAVARIPKGVSVYVPKSAAKLFRGYKEAEKNAGKDIVNMQGTKGIEADRDEATKKALRM